MRRCLTLGTLLVLAVPSLARPQSYPPDTFFWEITPQIGFLVSEEPEGSEIEVRPLFGGRVGYRRWRGFGVEVHGGYAPLDLEVAGDPPEDIDLPAFIYGAEGVYAWPLDPRSDVFLALGVEGITYSPDRQERDSQSETNFGLSLGGGVHYLLGRSLALRADLRDHVIFDQLSDTARDLRLVDRGDTNNLEGSLGVSFLIP